MEMVELDAAHTGRWVHSQTRTRAKDREHGHGQGERTHLSSWGLTNTITSCTALKTTDSRRFCQKVLHRVFISQPLG